MSSLFQTWKQFRKLELSAACLCIFGFGCSPKVIAPSASAKTLMPAVRATDSHAGQSPKLGSFYGQQGDARPEHKATGAVATRAADGPATSEIVQVSPTPTAALVEQPTADTSGGHLAKAEIQKVVSSAKAEVQRCYEEGIHRNASLTGTVAVRFVIGLDGRVKAVASYEPKTNLADPDVVQCVVAAIGVLRFPEPEGGSVSVVYPLRLAQAK
jgi:hypothetical protein